MYKRQHSNLTSLLKQSVCFRRPRLLLRIRKIRRRDLRLSPASLFREIRETPAALCLLGVSDQDANDKYTDASDDYLKSRAEERRIHVAIANPANDQELDRND